MQRVIEGVPAAPGRTCMLSSIVTTVRHLRPDADISEAIVLGFGAGLSFRYGYYERPRAVDRIAIGLPDIACFHISLDAEYFAASLQRFGIALIEREHSSITEMVEVLKTDLACGRPVLVILNDRHLPYLPNQLRKDEGRFVICHGWDDSSGLVWVIDQAIPSGPRVRQGPIPIADFVRALNLRNVVHDEIYPTWHLLAEGTATEFTDADVAASVERSYRTMAEGGTETLRFGISKLVYRRGTAGIRSLADDVKQRTEMDTSDEVRRWLKEVYALLAMHAGPVTARSLYADYLCWAAGKRLVPLRSSMVLRMRQLAEAWSTIANLLCKAAVSRNSAACLERAGKRILDAAEMEQALMNDLRSCVTGIG